jgi:Calpain family cysteine protease
LQALQNAVTGNFASAVVSKPWDGAIGALYTPNATQLGTLVSNQATLISPLGTTGRHSTYISGGMIQWSAKTGAVLISAAMANIYKARGDAGSWLGFATGKEYAYQGGIRQDFEGGYLFKDVNQAVALRPNQMPNVAPSTLIINGLQSSYNTNSMLQLSTSYVGDSNGWNDVARVDFWLTNAQGQSSKLSGATSFSFNNDFGASFQYRTNLSGSGIVAGTYTFRAVAYDKAGLAGTSFSQAISIVRPNIAPSSIIIQGLQTSYDSKSTLTISNGFVWDANGGSDVANVDFWLVNSQGARIDRADVTSFSCDTNNARFNYSMGLSDLSAGSYKLYAIAYDKSGAGSAAFTKDFSILRTRDWFDINLKDVNVASIARSAAEDRYLSRNEMISIFKNIGDGGIIDSIELGDIKTLATNANATGSLFLMQAHVHYLISKVVAETTANMQSSLFEREVMGKWFLGTVLPGSYFTAKTMESGVEKSTRYDFTYQVQSGSLFGNSNQARISGIDQGKYLSDCALLASLGATFASHNNDSGQSTSSIINSMLIDNGDETYTVRFFEKDSLQAQWVTVDRRLAFKGDKPFGAAVSAQDGLWTAIIEKAYAQWREWNEGAGQRTGWDIIGNTDNIADGLTRVTGRQAKRYGTGFKTGSSGDFSFNMIQQAVSSGKSVVAGGAIGSLYLVGGHAYSVTNAYTSSSGGQRIVVRNPWGKDANSNYGKLPDDKNPHDGYLDFSYEEFRAFQRLAIA